MKSTILLSFVSILLYLVSCNSPKTNTTALNTESDESNASPSLFKAVDPPIKDVDVSFSTHEVNTKEEKSIHLSSGTTINIPSNAFVNANGERVEGKVDLKFREFHKASEIILSGIIMQDQSTGQHMETAGMFEIKGSQNGEPVFIDEKKSIEVDLASFAPQQSFDSFILDKKNCKWQKTGSGKAKVNLRKQNALKQLDAETPAKPKIPLEIAKKDALVFDIDADYKKFPELKSFHGVVWQLIGDEKFLAKNEALFDNEWQSIAVAKAEKGYSISLKDESSSVTLPVKPVLTKTTKGNDILDTQMANYKKVIAQQIDKRERLEKEADLTRVMQVNRFGIYNWDIWKQPGRVLVNAQLRFDTETQEESDVDWNLAIQICNSKREVVKYTKSTIDRFSFNPNEDNALLVFLPNDKVAIFGKEDFKNLDLDILAAQTKPQFNLKTIHAQIGSIADLDRLIDVVL